MPMAGLGTLDRTLHKTNRWLIEIEEALGYGDRKFAYHALRAVLHTLRDGLTVEEALDLSAQLPLLLKGVFVDGWSGHPDRDAPRTPVAFVGRVADRMSDGPPVPDAQALTQAVLGVLQRHVSQGEIRDVAHILPQRLKGLWPVDPAR